MLSYDSEDWIGKKSAYHVPLKWMPIDMKMNTTMIPPITLAMAWKGGIRGDPTKPLMTVQSKESGIRPYPDMPPKSLLTITLLGAAQQAKVK